MQQYSTKIDGKNVENTSIEELENMLQKKNVEIIAMNKKADKIETYTLNTDN